MTRSSDSGATHERAVVRSSSAYMSTYFGEPLSAESQSMVAEFDSDFNIYRFIMNAERAHKNRNTIIESASKALNNHLRLRETLKLDDLPDIPFEENVIFRERFLPRGQILDVTDSSNRLLWYIEYATISIEGIAHGMKSSEAIRYQFWQFEHMLRRVNRQEKLTRRLSSLRHIIDMSNYEINPFTMIFVSSGKPQILAEQRKQQLGKMDFTASGTLSYYSQLFHYENYPELVNPIEMVNIAKWIHVPYKLINAMMPAGFSDRFRLHDGDFIDYLRSEIKVENIPQSLGGENSEIKCVPAEKNPVTRNWQPKNQTLLDQTECIQVPARRCRYYRIAVAENNGAKQTISWYFQTDGDVYFGMLSKFVRSLYIGASRTNSGNIFGVFYEPSPPPSEGLMPDSTAVDSQMHNHRMTDADFDEKEYAYPWLKLSAKLYHEHDSVECGSKPGIYYLVFSNRHSWLQRRNLSAFVQLTIERESDKEGAYDIQRKRFYHDGSTEILQKGGLA